MSAGRIAVLGYVLVYLVIPMIGLPILGRPDYSSYHYSGNSLVSVLVILGFLAACLTPLFSLDRLVTPSARVQGVASAAYRALQRFILPLSLSLLVSILLLFPPDLANYRYLSTGISGKGAAFFLAIALKSVITALLVWLLAEFVREPQSIRLDRRLAVLALVIAQIYGASGTGDLFAASFFVLLFLSPKWFIRLATIDRGTSMVSGRNLYKFLGIGLIAVMAAVSMSVGENIKDGVGSVTESIASSVASAVETVQADIGTLADTQTAAVEQQVAPPNVDTAVDTKVDIVVDSPAHSMLTALVDSGNWFVVRMLEGTASHYYSTLQFFDGFAQMRLESHDAPISYPINAFRYRLDVLLGEPAPDRPPIQSISRLNFVVLSERLSPTEGTSPGAVASFAYLMPVPIAMVVALAYLVLVSTLLNQLFRSESRKISLFGGIAIMIQVQVLFQSPLDFALIIDNGSVFLLTFALLSLVTGLAGSQAVSAAPPRQEHLPRTI